MSKKGRGNSNLAGPLSYAFVKDRTSPHMDDFDNKEATLFDRSVNSFRDRKDEAELLIKEAITSALPKVFKAYTTKPQWTTIDESNRGQSKCFPNAITSFDLLVLM